MDSKDQESTILDAVNMASNAWKSAFNAGDAAGCANQYESGAVMRAEPFGTYIGRADIQAFWQNLIDEGYGDVEYIGRQIKVIDASSAVLTSGWKMNKAEGLVHKELWVLQHDGSAKLRDDHFEATG